MTELVFTEPECGDYIKFQDEVIALDNLTFLTIILSADMGEYSYTLDKNEILKLKEYIDGIIQGFTKSESETSTNQS